MVKYFDKNNFDAEVLNSETPVLVDFYAEWCGPCKMLTPIIESLVSQFEGKVSIGKIDIDKEPELSEKYQVMSVPTLLFIKNGEILHREVGLVPLERLKLDIENYLLKS